MTASPPPGQPPGAPPPGWGQQPPPGWLPPPGPGQPGPGHMGPGQTGPGQFGPGQPGPGHPPAAAGSGFSMDLKKLRIADYVVAGGTVLYLILAMLPWWDFEFFTVSGFEGSGSVSSAFVLFLLATAWAVLPAFTDLKVGFPRAWITVGLAGLGFLLTLVAWIDTLSFDFSVFALLGLLTAAAILLFAVFTLLPELRTKPGLPGGLANAAQWANQPAPEMGGARPADPAHGQPGPSFTGTATPPTTPMTAPIQTPPAAQTPPPPPAPWQQQQPPPPPPSGGADRPPGT
jgi:hypothetical protein